MPPPGKDRTVRLSKITTRTGDDGSTGLADGTRLSKDSPRIEALGAVDELNSQLGLLLTEPLPGSLRDPLLAVQHALFDLGGELAVPGRSALTAEQVLALEQTQAALNATLPPLREFVLPGGSRAGALCHMARAACRRAERSLVRVARDEPVSATSLKYLNRLSDLLFVMARTLNREQGIPETLWGNESDRTTMG